VTSDQRGGRACPQPLWEPPAAQGKGHNTTPAFPPPLKLLGFSVSRSEPSSPRFSGGKRSNAPAVRKPPQKQPRAGFSLWGVLDASPINRLSIPLEPPKKQCAIPIAIYPRRWRATKNKLHGPIRISPICSSTRAAHRYFIRRSQRVLPSKTKSTKITRACANHEFPEPKARCHHKQNCAAVNRKTKKSSTASP
jgi:hypothetical protein